MVAVGGETEEKVVLSVPKRVRYKHILVHA